MDSSIYKRAGDTYGYVLTSRTELYTDESPGLKVDPFVVMVLSIGFIISVVALHSKLDHYSGSALVRFVLRS